MVTSYGRVNQKLHFLTYKASQVALVVKNPPANSGDTGDSDSIPGLGISHGEGNGNPLQYSCLENSRDRGGWQATVHGSPSHTHTNNIERKTSHDLSILKLFLYKIKSYLKSYRKFIKFTIAN